MVCSHLRIDWPGAKIKSSMISLVNAVRFVDLLNVFRLVLLVLALHDETVPEQPGDEEDEE